MKISILTVCPEQLASLVNSHTIRRAKSLGVLDLQIVDIRDYTEGSFRDVDDSPYGGGDGMLLRVDAVHRALQGICEGEVKPYIVCMTPEGETFTQKKAKDLGEIRHLALLCGHYEGFDERIFSYVDERISLGDFVLTGGEIPAMAVTDAIVRLLPGVLKKGSSTEESFNEGLLDYPQYTRPAEYEGQKVPEVLLSGDHGRIEAWRREEALRKTEKFRPDLMEKGTDRT